MDGREKGRNANRIVQGSSNNGQRHIPILNGATGKLVWTLQNGSSEINRRGPQQS
jgi:hypothetical protein